MNFKLIILGIGFLFICLHLCDFCNFDTQELFNVNNAHQMCHNLTVKNCRIPTVALNDCWVNNYFKCMGNCEGMCKCAYRASMNCQSSNSPAEACHSSTYQKCMAGRVPGFTDPDRYH